MRQPPPMPLHAAPCVRRSSLFPRSHNMQQTFSGRRKPNEVRGRFVSRSSMRGCLIAARTLQVLRSEMQERGAGSEHSYAIQKQGSYTTASTTLHARAGPTAGSEKEGERAPRQLGGPA